MTELPDIGRRTGSLQPKAQGEGLVIIVDVLHEGESPLLGITRAACLARFLTRLREDREQNRRQNGDNRNDDQQLNQGKASAITSHSDTPPLKIEGGSS